ncbi:hypothetical protein G9A89_007718 [Geosiphon pyriformis]|nr:hypothetical protein G9A89_007718 [Geosiphon pyriformis]
MAGRRIFDGSDSSEDEKVGITNQDFLEEQELFEAKGYKRRKFTKEDAYLGVFAENDEEDERFIRKPRDVHFVSSSSAFQRDLPLDDDEQQNDEIQDDYRSSSDESEEGPRPVPDFDDEEDLGYQIGGLGIGGTSQIKIKHQESRMKYENETRPGLGTGLGFGPNNVAEVGSGVGFNTSFAQDVKSTIKTKSNTSQFQNTMMMGEMPNFQFSSTKESSFATKHARKGKEASASSPRVVDKEFGKFEQHTKGIGLKLMQKMGYRVGEGLGTTGEGILKPIETKQRPGKLGLAYGGFKEKSQQQEDKRRGGPNDDVEETARFKIVNSQKKEAWKKSAKPKHPKVEYKTAEEIITEFGENPLVQPMKIIDMTGPQVREISSASQITNSLAIPDSSNRLLELRHNLRLIVDMSKADLEHFVREQRIQRECTKALENEEFRVNNLVIEESQRIKRLSEISSIVRECGILLTSVLSEDKPSLQNFTGLFEKLQNEYQQEYTSYGLDAAIIAVITPIIKKILVDWDPLKAPTFGLATFQKWRPLFKTNSNKNKSDFNGNRFSGPIKMSPSMTPYESMMYNIWLPKIRSTINNSWDTRNFDPVITLLENWNPPLLPIFIYDNILEQLIMPKLRNEIDNWNPKKDDRMIHLWLHPWLPILHERMEPLYITIRQKFSVELQAWHPSSARAITILHPWKKVFRPTDMQSLLKKSILPKLSLTLRTELNLNPKKENLAPFNWVISWREMFNPLIFDQLFATEFFPQWFNTLHTWLTHNPNYDEVVQWYSLWKGRFPSEMVVTEPIKTCFKQGLEMMNESSTLGAEGSSRLSHPLQYNPAPDETDITSAEFNDISESISFKDLVQEFAHENDYLLLSANKTHEISGKPLFRFGCTSQGVGGVLLYMKDDVMYVQEGKEWTPIGFEEILEKVDVITRKKRP